MRTPFTRWTAVRATSFLAIRLDRPLTVSACVAVPLRCHTTRSDGISNGEKGVTPGHGMDVLGTSVVPPDSCRSSCGAMTFSLVPRTAVSMRSNEDAGRICALADADHHARAGVASLRQCQVWRRMRWRVIFVDAHVRKFGSDLQKVSAWRLEREALRLCCELSIRERGQQPMIRFAALQTT